MAAKWLIGGVAGGLVVFFWGAVAHVALPLGMMGMSVIEPEKEGPVLEALAASIPADGLYFVPGRDMTRELTESEQKAWEAKQAAGPSGIMIIAPKGGEVMSPRQLLTELATGIVGSLVAGALVLTTRLGYLGRVAFVTALGLFGWLSIGLPNWNWYGFPTPFTAALLIEEVVGWFLAGLAIAAIVKPAGVKAVVPAGADLAAV